MVLDTQPKKRPTTYHRPDLLKVLSKNSKYAYRWVQFDRVRQNGGIHHNGWIILTNLSKGEEEIIKEHALEGINFVDGCVRRYELALAFMPRDQWQALKDSKDFDRRTQRDAVKRKTPDLDILNFEQTGRQ